MNRRRASRIHIVLAHAQSLLVGSAGALVLVYGDVAWPGVLLIGLAVVSVAMYHTRSKSDRALCEAIEQLSRRVARSETASAVATETLAYYAKHENWLGQSITEPSPGSRARAAINRLANP